MTTSAIDWNWPGARWWRFDLHVHSPQSSDWRGDASATPQQWVEAAVAARLHAVALTDHNSSGWVDRVKAAAAGRLAVFPGAEITTDSGAHLLVILPEEADGGRVAGVLGACGVDLAHPQNAQARTTKSFLEVAEVARKSGIAIAAHVDGPAGLVDRLSGGALRAAIREAHLDAFEWKGPHTDVRSRFDGTDPSFTRPGGALAIVQSSDAHELDHIGSRFTWLKMARPSMEGLRLALMDPDLSVQVGDGGPADPNAHANCVIEKLSVTCTKHIGNGTPFEVSFSPWLNAIIGGRGTGKSSLVEFTRLVARRESELPKFLRKSFDDLARVPASRGDLGLLRNDERGESELQLIYRRDGARFRLRWNVTTDVIEIHFHRDHRRPGSVGRCDRERYRVCCSAGASAASEGGLSSA
ncbi:MAG: PHP domain-containing protein, partial [Archangium sp.]|nr:PHP domain-containing protein [Archangium sp.]MDP3572122.1 PHP domain-containing protein [Archangium sp.]